MINKSRFSGSVLAALVAVMMLFLYLPYTKLAHIAYRTTAMAFEKYRESAFMKPAVE